MKKKWIYILCIYEETGFKELNKKYSIILCEMWNDFFFNQKKIVLKIIKTGYEKNTECKMNTVL